jgi:hypothetical protein
MFLCDFFSVFLLFVRNFLSVLEKAADTGNQAMKDLTQEKGLEAQEAGGRVRYAANPFWEDLVMETRFKRAKLKTDDPRALVSMKTGQSEGVVEVARVYEVDSDKFVKVFTRYLHAFFDVSKNGQRLFEYALAEAGKNPNRDTIHLHPKDADRYHKGMGRGGYSQASFYRAADELCDVQILARGDVPGRFFVNPAIFWNGDRAKFVTELRKSPQLYAPEELDPTQVESEGWAVDWDALEPFSDDEGEPQ